MMSEWSWQPFTLYPLPAAEGGLYDTWFATLDVWVIVMTTHKPRWLSLGITPLTRNRYVWRSVTKPFEWRFTLHHDHRFLFLHNLCFDRPSTRTLQCSGKKLRISWPGLPPRPFRNGRSCGKLFAQICTHVWKHLLENDYFKLVKDEMWQEDSVNCNTLISPPLV